MSENNKLNLLHHRGKVHQVPIYLGKQFRSFLYMNDWKMLPMAAVIAALVSMVIRKKIFITMEGTLAGALALTCVALWNGCFNSVQVICRERAIIKREHRSGMRVFSYVISCMIYQALICIGQTVVTMYMLLLCGVKIPAQGFMTPWMILDIGITVFLITYAADMLSLLISSIAHSTTSAMTVMPFVLIFQLVFSGSLFNLPQWAEGFSKLTLSHYGLTCITVQADYNSLPMMTGWNTLAKMEDHTEEGEISVGQIMSLAQMDSVTVNELRERTITIKKEDIEEVAKSAGVPKQLVSLLSMGVSDEPISFTVGDVIDMLIETVDKQGLSDESISYSIRVGDVMDMFDRTMLQRKVIEASTNAMYQAEYARSEENVWFAWAVLAGYAALFAILSMVSLSFIDKDKR